MQQLQIMFPEPGFELIVQDLDSKQISRVIWNEGEGPPQKPRTCVPLDRRKVKESEICWGKTFDVEGTPCRVGYITTAQAEAWSREIPVGKLAGEYCGPRATRHRAHS